jgi:hypothetical protein
MDVNGLLFILLTTIIALLAWSLKKLISIDKSAGTFREWTLGHEKIDDERHRENLTKFDSIFAALNHGREARKDQDRRNK